MLRWGRDGPLRFVYGLALGILRAPPLLDVLEVLRRFRSADSA